MGSNSINYGNVQPDAINYGAHAEAPPEGSATDATISAVPPPQGLGQKVAQWADNVRHDLKYGTTLTGIGTVLSKMGAHGLDVGNSEKLGDFMGSLPLGILRATKGAAEAHEQPVQGAKDLVGGAAEAATMPAMLAGAPEVAEGAAAAVDAIPNAARAGEKFQQVMAKAGNVPIDLSKAQVPAIDAMRLADAGSTQPKVIGDFLKRIPAHTTTPMLYSEARLFAQNAGQTSVAERLATNPAMQRQVSILAGALNDANEAAADSAGVGDLYRSAMKEYSQAKTLQNAVKTAAKYVVRAAVPAGAYEAYKAISK